MQTWQFMDKSKWHNGEWNNEPDKAHWIDKKTNLDCLIVRNPAGALCGYVAVTEGHPLFNKEYDEAYSIEVHGGLTFSDFCQDNPNGICHIPEKGRQEKVWWLGFDCAHAGDFCPAHGLYFKYRIASLGVYETYKDFEYVKEEVEKLAMQLKEYLK